MPRLVLEAPGFGFAPHAPQQIEAAVEQVDAGSLDLEPGPAVHPPNTPPRREGPAPAFAATRAQVLPALSPAGGALS